MPYGYLITVAVTGWFVFFALVPLHGRFLGRISFRSGLVVSELPFAALAWLSLWTAVAAAQGDLAAPAAQAVAAAASAAGIALVAIARRSARARPVIDQALAAGLGVPAATAPLTWRRRAALLLAPLPVRPLHVRRVRNIAYGPAGERNLLDVHHHRSRPAGGPVLIHLHGGGFTGGRKGREARLLTHRLAGRGWVCISATYRLRPGSRYPDPLVDTKRIIAWARAHAGEYGADPSMVVVSGSSAGAHLAAMAAFTQGDPALQPGFEDADTSVAAAVCLYGYYGEVYEDGPATSALEHVHDGAPPFLVAHGDHDTCMPVDEARAFAGRLRAASRAPVVYAELPGAQHCFDLFRSPRFEALVDGIEVFTAHALAGDAGDAGARRGEADGDEAGGVSGRSPADGAGRRGGTPPRSAAARAAGARPAAPPPGRSG
ncbi:alpha/beta hydrolase [Actinomadura litoris]|uniref:Alpha/beta hydrolase fold domain-containing protein n=1 Tax=Actinomadura litoris TaxID=2678616 RepID=A0A7K1KZH6_9ACTN|nr:alpha/beta hydrolase [Actinomadura litoris]MUN37598.1 alpha/beta hydrolase fold domain-containing protein [Actinomadura litoris]